MRTSWTGLCLFFALCAVACAPLWAQDSGRIHGVVMDSTGAVIPGVSTVGGAVAGAILGGVLGAVIKGRQYYRDTRGYCYYVDQNGQPQYDYNVRC